ncbi:hypothetical protein [Vreelandella alkaliphila]|uniref:hypothetical protein n=1 Tax=Vreelandella alkaliphila TaxID=272774 RepID=UPI003F9D0B3E
MKKEEIANNKSLTVYSLNSEDKEFLLAFFNSKIARYIINIFNPTVGVGVGDIVKLPFLAKCKNLSLDELAKRAVDISKGDWDKSEVSLGFSELLLIKKSHGYSVLKRIYKKNREKNNEITQELKFIESDINRVFIETYKLQNELDHEVSLEEVSLTCNPYYRYAGNRTEEELETLLQCDTLKELVSYAIGCMMGRYSLDKPGLILASQGETVRDYLAQIPEPSFAPDKNAIIPLTDQEWFPDDATNRFRDFVRIIWGEEHLQANLDFVAESLCLHAIKPKKGEAALDTIRRYLSTQFFKDHLRTYKKRPIYWLFSSGKQKAFECLVYLHRYNESTLAEMRTDYVIPLTTKLASYVEKLEQDKDASTSAAEAKAIEKELGKLYKQQAELNTFDEKLRHYADQRITLDLDDGVKVNYGKFGDLLAEVKQVAGNNS